MRVLGIMSGTSLDGVDYVICAFNAGGKCHFVEHWQVAFSADLKRSLLSAASGKGTSHELAQLHHDLGRFYQSGAASAKVDLVGLHGQTVFHRAHRTRPASLQIGEAAYLAESLRVPVISNFRAADLAAGGQGAPLATIFHREVFARKGRHIAVNNLGGISNVTSLDWRGGREARCMAFDTGPANILIDLAVRRATGNKQTYDAGGHRAARGAIHHSLVSRWLRCRYFRQSPPKSTGRELFGEPFLDRYAGELHGDDLIATLTEFTAQSIALNYRLHLSAIPDEVILCGGGAENPFLVTRIAEAIQELNPSVILRTSSHDGWHPQMIEGAAFALLAWKCWHQQPGNIPETTGAAGPRVLGAITWPFSSGQGAR